MIERSALDRTCEKHGCAKMFLDPKLHDFDDCFGGLIRMGDLDFAVERNGHILWGEWKRGAVLDSFEKTFQAQFRQAREFTRNSPKQTFVFVVGCPVAMNVERFRIIENGQWKWDWQEGGTQRFKAFLRHWFSHADKQRAAS